MRGGWLQIVRTLMLGAAVMLLLGGLLAALGRLRSAAAPSGEACAPIAGWRAVAVTALAPDGRAYALAGFAADGRAEGEPVGSALVSLQEAAEASGARLYWDDPGRTVSLLSAEDVLSVHFPGGSESVDQAVLNGKVIPLRAVLCADGVYLPAAPAAEVLKLTLVRVLPR